MFALIFFTTDFFPNIWDSEADTTEFLKSYINNNTSTCTLRRDLMKNWVLNTKL